MRWILMIVLLVSSTCYSQVFSGINLTPGFCYAGQIKNPSLPDDGGEKMGFSLTIEPIIESFGTESRFHLNCAITYAQKGGYTRSPVHTYDQFGQIVSTGSEKYAVSQNYIAISPTLSFDYGEHFYIKAGPRMDLFAGFRSGARYSADNRSKEDFSKYNYGATIALGFLTKDATEKTQFCAEIVGQPDFNTSTTNPASMQEMQNFAFLLNFGVKINLVPVPVD